MSLFVALSDDGLIENISLELAQSELVVHGPLYDWMWDNHPDTAEAFYNQLWGGHELSQPVDRVIRDFLAAELEFVSHHE